MPPPTPTSAPNADQPDAQPDAWTEDRDHARAILRTLIDTAAEMAQIAHQHAMTQALEMARDPGPHHRYIDFTLPFERASRCARRGIILQMTLHDPLPTGYDIALAAQKRAAALARAQQQIDTPEHVERVERFENVERIERIDRIDREDFAGDMDRPIGEIIAEMYADLGLTPPDSLADWAHRTPNDLASGDPTQRDAAHQAITAALQQPPPFPLRL